MGRTFRIALGLSLSALVAGCEVRSTRIVGKDEGKLRTEDFAGTWVAILGGQAHDTIVMSGVSARPAVLLVRNCADGDSAVVELTSGGGLKFFNTIELHPRKEEFAWSVFDRSGDTIRMDFPRSEFFAEAVRKGRLRGKVDSTGSVLLTDRSENVVSFLRRIRGSREAFEGKPGRLVRLPAGCAGR